VELRQTTVEEVKLVSFGHEPLVPVHVSAMSHVPVDARHVTVLALKASTQESAVPRQWSPASLSQRPLCELPVQATVDDLKLSPGHALLAPVQFSATSHCPPTPGRGAR
jgi:hypothetical protein